MEVEEIAHDKPTLQVVMFSDLHDGNPDRVHEWISTLDLRPHVILYAGDALRSFQTSEANQLERIARLSTYGLWAVPGNEGTISEQRELIKGERVYDASKRPTLIGPFALIGHTSQRPFRRGSLDLAARYANGQNLIVLSHFPPYGILDRSIRHRTGGSGHSGKEELTEFVEETKNVRLVVSGHSHLMGGRSKSLGNATVVNAASQNGTLEPINLGITSISEDGTVRPVRWEKVRPGDPKSWHLQRVPGIAGKRGQMLVELGILTLEDLAEASIERLRKENQSVDWERIQIRARALHTRESVLFKKISLPSTPYLYLDIETDLDQRSLVWLVSTYCPEENEVQLFYASSPEQEGVMLEEVSRYLRELDDRAVIHYSGTNLDERVLKERLRVHSLTIPKILDESIDLCTEIRNHVGLPESDYTLDTVARWAGYSFNHPDKDGVRAANKYFECVEEGVELPDWIFAYAKDDVLSLASIVEELESREFLSSLRNRSRTNPDPSNACTTINRAVESPSSSNQEGGSRREEPETNELIESEKTVTYQNLRVDAAGVIEFIQAHGLAGVIEDGDEPQAVLLDWDRFEKLRKEGVIDG